jgi:hypothetical protein
MNNKVTILGKLPTKNNAPFNNKDWDIWAFNYHNDILPRVTKWFDIHANKPNPKADITRSNFPFEAVEELVGGQLSRLELAPAFNFWCSKLHPTKCHIFLRGRMVCGFLQE